MRNNPTANLECEHGMAVTFEFLYDGDITDKIADIMVYDTDRLGPGRYVVTVDNLLKFASRIVDLVEAGNVLDGCARAAAQPQCCDFTDRIPEGE
jgi:hypothetical protein